MLHTVHVHSSNLEVFFWVHIQRCVFFVTGPLTMQLNDRSSSTGEPEASWCFKMAVIGLGSGEVGWWNPYENPGLRSAFTRCCNKLTQIWATRNPLKMNISTSVRSKCPSATNISVRSGEVQGRLHFRNKDWWMFKQEMKEVHFDLIYTHQVQIYVSPIEISFLLLPIPKDQLVSTSA